MLKLADLAGRSDFDAGPLHVSPARRLIEGPAGHAHVEPIVMKVFLLLLDADGSVVTRDELFGNAWGGVFVGDDSLNRAIAQVRKIAAETAPGMFEVETIPRTGYRLTGDIVGLLESKPDDIQQRLFSRRSLIGGGTAIAATVGGAGLWWATRSRNDLRFNALMARGEEIVRNTAAIGDPKTIRIFEEAVSIKPDNARAWGLLGLVRSMALQTVDPVEGAGLANGAEEAARRARAINPKEPNALLTIFELQGYTLDWPERDRNLRQIITLDPRNVIAITELVALLQSAGLNQESWNWNERAIAIVPLSPDLLCRRALKLWIGGRVAQADRVIDQVRDLYPSYNLAAWVRFIILALTGRPKAAQAMLDTQPNLIAAPPAISLWQSCLPALIRPSPATIAAARHACIAAASRAGQLAAQGVMILSGLGEIDAAFDIANGFLLWRGSTVRRGETQKELGNDTGWRLGIQWLFTPPAAAMRADPRFVALCEGVGLTGYWHTRGVRPDYQLT
jgi:DNA-binding winged helix-turn-helix (wHTH) protein